MFSWRKFPQVLGPRVQEVMEWPATTHMRFDNGLYLRVEPLVRTLEVYLRFALFEGSDGMILTLPMTKAAHQMRGGRGYRAATVVVIPFAKKNRGGTPEDAAGLEDLRTSLGANYARLRISLAGPRDLHGGRMPASKARADFIVVGDDRGPMHQPDYTDAALRIGRNLDHLMELLTKAVARSHTTA